MSYLIVATDFTETSLNAVSYAANMAIATGYPLVVLHAFSLPVMVGDVPLPASLIDDTQADMEKKMDLLVQNVTSTHNDLRVTGHVRYGTVTDVIDKYAAGNHTPFLTIIGNTNTRENTVWILSTLSDACANLNLPILAIPPEATFKTAPVFCLALDLTMENISAPLQQVCDIAMAMQAKLHVVNVGNNDAQGNRLLTDKIEIALLPARPKYNFIPGDNINEDIDAFCQEKNVSLLAVIRGQRSFVDSLMHKSHTKALAKTMQLPLLVLHQSQK